MSKYNDINMRIKHTLRFDEMNGHHGESGVYCVPEGASLLFIDHPIRTKSTAAIANRM